tara:strand:- start:411 stop:860 length:450 start_codon:yes stop_codon:yes gene_type:complete
MATMTVTIQEELTINGKDRGNKNQLSISSVSEVFTRVLTVGNTEQNILEFQATNPSGGAIADTTLQYLRITNLAASNTVDLRIQDTANTKEYFVQLGGSESYILFNDKMDCDSAAVNTTISLSQIDFISADATGTGGETADVEIFAVAT